MNASTESLRKKAREIEGNLWVKKKELNRGNVTKSWNDSGRKGAGEGNSDIIKELTNE